MINHVNQEMCQSLSAFGGNRELMHKKSIPYCGLFVPEQSEGNEL